MKKPFVDRIEELRHLSRALKYDEKETPVLVFTGIGGMGKTALRIAFEEEILKPNKIPYAVLDYDGDPNLRPIETTLRTIRRHLGKHKVKTPVFDFLYARYFELSTGLKFSKKNHPPELEGVVTVLTEIPGFGNVPKILYGLSKIGLAVRERLLHKEWLYRIRDLEPREVLNLLPGVLAEDLEEVMTAQTVKTVKQSGYRIPLLFDAYEFLADSHIDDTLHRKLFLMTPHLLRVIFTRASLRWEHTFPKEWRGKITHIPSLDNLRQEDTTILLRKRQIDSDALQEHLFQLTGGYPLHLELCADICREIKEATKREPEVHDFKGAAQAKSLTEELVNRLLRQLTENESDLMELAAYPRWVSEEILEVLSSVPESVPRIFKKFTKLSMFSPHAEIPDAYVIRKEVRDYLMQRQRRERLFKQRHAKLSAFHKERWEETPSFLHLREALYHTYYENTDDAMKMFEAHFWKLLEKFSFSEAEGLLEAVPLDTVSEEQKRKIDYARARFLTSTAHSKGSLLIAKKLYESLIESETDEASLSQYLLHLGSFLCDTGEYRKGINCHEKALDIRLKIYGKEHPAVAESYHSVGIIHCKQSEYVQAVTCHQKALEIRLRFYGEKHPTTATSYHNIGTIYYMQSQYEQALEYYQKSLAIWLKVYGDEHPKVASSYNNLGNVYYRLGEYGKALEYFQKSLAIWLKVYGEEHPSVAHSYHNTGNVYCEQGEYEKALDCYQMGLTIRLKVYGEEHPAVAGIYHNIGVIYRDRGEYETALEYLKKSLAIDLKIYDAEHQSVSKDYHNIGIIYSNQGESARALKYLQKSLVISLKLYGERHPLVADSYLNIGNAYSVQGEYEKALEYFQKSLAIFLEVYGERHPDVAGSYGNIATVYRKKGEHKKALDLHQKSLAIFREVHGEEHPNVAEAYNGIAFALWALKRDEDALEKMRKSAEIYRKYKLRKEVVQGLETLASWLEEKGKTKEAEEARAEVQTIRKGEDADVRE